MREGERRGIREGEGRPTYRSRGPATTSCSHLARVIPATQWPLQVLVSCETPCFALRVPAGRRWRRRRRNVERELNSVKTVRAVRGAVLSQRCAISRLHGDNARIDPIRPEIDTRTSAIESIDFYTGGGDGASTLPCEFWKPEISRKIHSATILTAIVNIYCVRYVNTFTSNLERLTTHNF